MDIADAVYLFVGVALEDIPNATVGYIKHTGWIGFGEMNLWTCNSGDLVGIVNGAFAKIDAASAANRIGVATNNKGFYLK